MDLGFDKPLEKSDSPRVDLGFDKPLEKKNSPRENPRFDKPFKNRPGNYLSWIWRDSPIDMAMKLVPKGIHPNPFRF